MISTIKGWGGFVKELFRQEVEETLPTKEKPAKPAKLVQLKLGPKKLLAGQFRIGVLDYGYIVPQVEFSTKKKRDRISYVGTYNNDDGIFESLEEAQNFIEKHLDRRELLGHQLYLEGKDVEIRMARKKDDAERIGLLLSGVSKFNYGFFSKEVKVYMDRYLIPLNEDKRKWGQILTFLNLPLLFGEIKPTPKGEI